MPFEDRQKSEKSVSDNSMKQEKAFSIKPLHAERIKVLSKVIVLFLLLYLFILSIKLMGTSFKLFGKDFAEQLIATTSNPYVGLLIGILATSVIQSSSTTTSLVVGLVGAGALTISNAIPIIMGSNIGTSITNTIVSMGHVSRSNEFRRAFAGSTVHDFFNLITVVILFPLQLMTNFLGHVSHYLADIFQTFGGLKTVSPINLITKPVVKVIEDLTGGSGVIILILSFLFLFFALRYLTVVLKGLIFGRFEALFDEYIFKTAVRGFLFGIIMTVLVQSSSITTSIAVPLIGAGILTLEQVFPYTLGANIGTTITAMLASLATGNIGAVTVAFAHLMFNVFGVIIVYPLKKIPLFLARSLADLATKNRLIPVGYILLVFFIIPFIFIYFVR
jgi:sodium-dependent phosphate cotransporter